MTLIALYLHPPQRAAFLYGRYESDPHKEGAVRAIVEAVFEPAQAGDANSVRILPDDKVKIANEIAGVFGLQMIGWMFTHPPRKAEEPLLAPELRNMAKLQNRFRPPSEPGSRFITV
ncbi:NPLOC4, partial [Symbiodinium sp. KB8]